VTDPTRQVLTITKGLPGSGKTTWAMQRVVAGDGEVKRVNKDELRAMIDGGRWSPANERLVVEIRNLIVRSALRAGCSVIVDDTNLAPQHERALRAIAAKAGVDFAIEDFTDVPLEECIRRDRVRAKRVGEDVIRRMWRDYLRSTIPVAGRRA
jgi:predicted kinase